MWLHSIKIKDLKCFKGEHPYEFSKHINLFVGANNSGKSTLMRALHLPEMASQPRNCLRIKAKVAVVELRFEDLDERFANAMEALSGESSSADVSFSFHDDHSVSRSLKFESDADWGEPRQFHFGKSISHKDNIFHPFFSGRKAKAFEENTTQKIQEEIRLDLSNLPQRLMKLTDPGSNYHERFKEACLDIIGHQINTVTLPNGTGAGIQVDEDNKIQLTDMGEGVPIVLGLLVSLFSDRKSRIFLIEEPENDLHPTALKKFLDLIVEHSDRHQFFISTHSSIVLRHLGPQKDTATFNVTSKLEAKIPTSEVQKCFNDMGNLRRIAESLGSTPFDSFLFDAYLVLEESSAQSIIENILIEHFTPKLKGRLKAISANGVNNVPNVAGSVASMFLVNHLSPAYEQRCWVMVDGGMEGSKVIEQIAKKFRGKDKFLKQLHEHDLERHYPSQFRQEADAALATQDSDKKRMAKKALLEKVLDWAKTNPNDVRCQFEEPAKEIIDFLKEIERCLEPGQSVPTS